MLAPHVSRGRRFARCVAVAATPVLLLVPVALAPSAFATDKSSLPSGLFGQQDPTYDGVYRHSLALLAYAAEDVDPPTEAVEWLLDQQCTNGGFEAFRATTTSACVAPNPATYSGPDTNATAMAAQALIALGEEAGLAALDYLESVQNSDGGIPTYAGGDTDANSTGLTAMAVSAAGIDPGDAASSSGKSLADALDALQVVCAGDADEHGAYDFQASGPLVANDFATVQAVVGRAGESFPLLSDTAAAISAPRLDCGSGGTSDPVVAGAGYLAAQLAANGDTIPDAFNPGGTDWGSTRMAVVALAAAGHGRDALVAAFEELADNQSAYLTDDQGDDRPGALAELILATNAALPSLAAAGVTITTADRGTVVRQTTASSVDTEALIERLDATLTSTPATTTEPTPDDVGSGSGLPDSEVTAGGTEIANTGPVSPWYAVSAAAMIALGLLMVAASRRRWEPSL